MKKSNYFLLLIMAFALIINYSCKKDSSKDTKYPPIVSDIVKEQNEKLAKVITTSTVNAFVQGFVWDENGLAIANAEITHGDTKVQTDENGHFVLQEITLNKDFAVIYAEKQGYFRGIRTFTPTQNAVNTIEFVLQRKGTAQALKASDGGRLNFKNNVILDFPKGSIADANGKPYNGEVKVYVRYIDPREENFASAMPGNLVGLRTNNELDGMISYGMAGIEMTDGSGRPLQVANGKTVTVTMPAILDAPNKMPIWHFNEQYGVWVQTGEVQKDGDTYSFEANHFSTWNLNIFVEDNINSTTIKLKDQNGDNIANQTVDVYTSDFSNLLGAVTTDHNGEFNLMYVPKEIGLRIIFECDGIDKTITLINNTINEITINDGSRAKTYQIGGVFKDCEDAIYPNTYYSIKGFQNLKINFSGKTDANGKYYASKVLCDIANGQNESIIATVFIGSSTLKRDTFNLIFNGQVLNQTLNVCKTEEEEYTNPYLNPDLTYGSITDIDGNKYATIKIGNQVWMAENLKTSKYNDGTAIPNITDNTAWENLTTGAYAYYDNNANHNATYGKLYNWYAVNTGKLCPKGWHIPTDAEWTQLTTYLGEEEAGLKMKATGNSTDGTGLWKKASGYSGAEGTNSSGFTGLPGSSRDYDGPYYGMGYSGYWWSSTEYGTDGAWNRFLGYNNKYVNMNGAYKRNGFSCRCVKD